MDALGDRIFGLEGNDFPEEMGDRVGRSSGCRQGSGVSSVSQRNVFPDIALIFSHAQGSRGENESSFGLEMSQIGFSTHRLKVGQTLTPLNI